MSNQSDAAIQQLQRIAKLVGYERVWADPSKPDHWFVERTLPNGNMQAEHLESVIMRHAVERDALARDADRMDWLDKHPREATIRIGTDIKSGVFYGISCDPKWTMREAIDAATAGDSEPAKG